MAKDDVDPQQFLPADLRKSWLLLTLGSVCQLLLFGIVLGACIALLIVESVHGVPKLAHEWPIAFVALVLLNRLFFRPRERRLLAELAARQTSAQELPIATATPPAATAAYGKRDVRAADLFALLLSAVGIAVAVLAAFVTFGAQDRAGSVPLWLAAVVFLALGTAMNLKVRELARRQRREDGEKRSDD